MKQPRGGAVALYAAMRALMKIFLTTLLFAGASLAAVATDGSLGSQRSLTGPEYNITADLGRIRGGNLFHSFETFSLTAGESATFSGPAQVENIIGRVTGGDPSLIDGTLRSTISGADLFLLNPSGILFGPNAALDITGSFHAGTADYLRFGDNGRFSAAPNPSQVLSAAPPEAFGFLSPNPADISVTDSRLEVPEGETLSLISGNIDITGITRTAQITTAGGRIELVGVGNPGEIQLDSPEILTSEAAGSGDIHITNAELSASGDPSGSVVIRGGRIEMNTALIASINSGAEDASGPGIDIEATLQLELLNDSNLYCSSEDEGSAGATNITAGWIHLDNSHIGTKDTDEPEPSGEINIKADTLEVINGSSVYAFGENDASDIHIEVGDTLKLVQGGIGSSSSGRGNGGKIEITANTILLQDRSIIQSQSMGQGDGGDVFVTAKNILKINDGQIASWSMQNGNGGDVNVTAGTLLLEDMAMIGSISEKQGKGGDIFINSENLSLFTNTIISTVGDGYASAGSININCTDKILLDNGNINTGALGFGNGGDIHLTAPIIDIRNWGRFLGKDPGIIGQIDSTSSIGDKIDSIGNAGNIHINAEKLIRLTNTEIRANVEGGADTEGGNIRLNAPHIILSESSIVANAYQGRGGNISISADLFLTDESSRVDASSAVGISGIVDIQAPESNLGERFSPLETDFLNAAGLLREPCEVRVSEGDYGSFVVKNRDALPVIPDALYMSPYPKAY